MQQRISELERRLYDTQEKALMFSVELKSREENQRQGVRQAEEVFEKLREGQRASEQERKMSERLGQLEGICSRLEANSRETAAGVGAAGLENNAIKNTLSLVMARLTQIEGICARLETGHRENAAGISANVGAAAAESGAVRSALAMLTERLGLIEGRLSSMESRINEILVKAELRDKMNARDNAITLERLDRLEKNAVPLDYVDKRLTGFELDSAMIRKVEGAMEEVSRKVEKLEGESQALLIEQAHAAENSKAEGTVLEELRAQFASMSVIFNHLRGSIKDKAQ